MNVNFWSRIMKDKSSLIWDVICIASSRGSFHGFQLPGMLEHEHQLYFVLKRRQ